jgi:hypothetical protein
VLVAHLASLPPAGDAATSAILRPTEGDELAARFVGLARNLMTLSGSAALPEAAWWIGPTLLAGAVAALARPRNDGADGGRRFPVLLVLALALTAACLLAATWRMTFWRPFSWRYGFLLFALVLAFATTARPFLVAGRRIPFVALPALAAPWMAGAGALACLVRSHAYVELHAAGGAEVGRFLVERTGPDEPVFATPDTWDRVVAPLAPRPNLVARNGGLYNFAPADVVAPRWTAYEQALAAGSAGEAREALRPFGARLAVLAREELARHAGLAALAGGFDVVLENARYVVVDLDAPAR